MSIANEITRIKNAKTDIATSIAKKGVTVPEETKIDGYSALIDEIQGGGGIEGTTGVVLDLTTIAPEQFLDGVGLSGVKTVILPNIEKIGESAFMRANELEVIDIGEKVDDIDTRAFVGITNLKALVFRGLYLSNSLRLNETAIPKGEGCVYVPDEYVKDYKGFEIFGVINPDKIKPLSEFEGDIGCKLQYKSVTPTEEQQKVTLDEGYYGLSYVTVEPIPGEYADVSAVTATADDVLEGKKIVTKDGELVEGAIDTVEPIDKTLTIEQPVFSIPKGYHEEKGTVSISTETRTETPNKETQTIKPASGKVLSEVTINPIPDKYQDVSDVTATPDAVLTDKKFVTADGELVSGTMPDNRTFSATLSYGRREVDIPAGYHNGKGKIKMADGYRETLDVDATRDDVLEGKTFADKDGYKTGSMKNAGKQTATLNGLNWYYPIPKGYHNGEGFVMVSVGSLDDITPTKEWQRIVHPDNDLIAAVVVSPIPDEYQDVSKSSVSPEQVLEGCTYVDMEGVHTGTIPIISGQSYSFGTEGVFSIPEGYYSGDRNLVTYSPNDYFTGFTTTPPEHVLEGQEFVDQNGYGTGTMPKHVKITKTLSTNGETYPIPQGYHDGEGVVTCAVEETGGINPEWTNWTYLSNGNNRNDLISKLKYDDTRNGTTFNNMCNGCTTLEEVPAINTEKGKSFLSMFTGCTGLKRVLEINVSNAANNNMMQKIFENCSSLEEVYFKGTFPVKNNLDVFSWCPKLDEENKQVLTRFLTALSDNTGGTTKTITIGSTNLAKLTADQIKIATDKNITLA